MRRSPLCSPLNSLMSKRRQASGPPNTILAEYPNHAPRSNEV